jgi:LacI family transcriptional regulator
MPTLRDLATELGLSVSTISLALRNSPKVNDKTRHRIRETADRLGYKPNLLVSAHSQYMRTGSRPEAATTVGILYYKRPEEMIPLFEHIERTIRESAEERGLLVDEIHYRTEGLSREKLRKVLIARGIESVFIAPVGRFTGELPIDPEGFALSTIGYSAQAPIHRACHDFFGSTRRLFQVCRERGYQRIGLALRKGDNERANELYIAAYLDSQFALPPERRLEPLVFAGDWDNMQLERWFARENPDAIISIGCQSIAAWALRQGISLPDDLGLVALPSHPELTEFSGMIHDYHTVCAAAYDLLLGQLRRNERGIPEAPKTVLLPGRFLNNGSLPRRS